MLQHKSIVSSLLLVFSGAKQAAHKDCTTPMEHGLYHTYGTDLGTIPKAGYGTDVFPYLWNEPCSIVWYRWAPRGLYHTFSKNSMHYTCQLPALWSASYKCAWAYQVKNSPCYGCSNLATPKNNSQKDPHSYPCHDSCSRKTSDKASNDVNERRMKARAYVPLRDTKTECC